MFLDRDDDRDSQQDRQEARQELAFALKDFAQHKRSQSHGFRPPTCDGNCNSRHNPIPLL